MLLSKQKYLQELSKTEMIGKEELANEEDPVLKVTDKRKFNVDGSLREGVTLDEPPQVSAPPSSAEESPIITSTRPEAIPSEIIDPQSGQPAVAGENPDEELSEEDLLDDRDPASFINFLSTLVTNAAASLGAMPHPVTGQKSVDLETGKYWIDVLLMLRKKTEGNLATQEKHLLSSILSDLQLQYVALTKTTEEKLKAQAAKKFSSKDILGG